MRKNSQKQRIEGKQKTWRQNNPDKISLYNKNRKSKNHVISKTEWDKCRIYFNFRCAYCGKTWEQNKKETNKDLHKEHVNDNGANDLSNCIPSCTSCNSQKWKFELDEWYTNQNNIYSIERYNKIMEWVNIDYKKYIEK